MSGLPVSRAAGSTPRDSSQSSASSSSSTIRRCSAGRRPGTRRGSPRGCGAARRHRSRAASSLPAGRPSRARPEPPELARAGRGHEAGHAGAGDGQVNENEGLCSMYSSFTRSGPQTKSASVFGASTKSAISTPSSSASACCSSTESTRTPRWLSSGRSGEPGSPCLSSSQAPPTSSRPSSLGGSRAPATQRPRRRGLPRRARRGRGRARSRSRPRPARARAPRRGR